MSDAMQVLEQDPAGIDLIICTLTFSDHHMLEFLLKVKGNPKGHPRVGKHLLSLINDILDLSKIEAGRMELELSTFHLPTAVSNAVTLIRERAMRHGIALGVDIDQRLGEFQADERKVKQILLNLLSNAVKFTPDGGRVDVSAKLDTDKVEIA